MIHRKSALHALKWQDFLRKQNLESNPRSPEPSCNPTKALNLVKFSGVNTI